MLLVTLHCQLTPRSETALLGKDTVIVLPSTVGAASTSVRPAPMSNTKTKICPSTYLAPSCRAVSPSSLFTASASSAEPVDVASGAVSV